MLPFIHHPPTSSLESLTQSLGRQLLEESRATPASALSKKFWSDKLLAYTLQNDRFKTELFRFIDVFPALRTPAAINQHLHEYLVRPDLPLPAGLALTQISFQAAMLLGPSLAAAIVAGWGLTVVYAVDAVTFLASIYGVLGLPPIAPESDPDDTGTAVRRVLAGLRFVTRSPVLRGSFLTDLAATALSFPVALFPVVNDERFGGSPRTLGLFLSSVAVGGVVASVLSGTYTRAGRQGVVMLVAAATWGAAIVAFGLVDGLVLTMLALAVAGAADTISVVSRSSITQVTTPDAYRRHFATV